MTEDWHFVQKRNRSRGRDSRWDNTRRQRLGIYDRKRLKTSFFFTSFSEDADAKKMYEEFKHFWDINEVLIPNKRDVRGKRYGFVRFFNVVDPITLAMKLDNLFMGN